MLIEFKRSGGFAGLGLELQVDTTMLAREAQRELTDLVTAADFFNVPTQGEQPSSGADQYHYRITITTANQRHTIATGELSAPSSLQPLLQRLTHMARAGQSSP